MSRTTEAASKPINGATVDPGAPIEESYYVDDVPNAEVLGELLDRKIQDFNDMRRMHKTQRERNEELTHRMIQMRTQIKAQESDKIRVAAGVKELLRKLERKNNEIRRLKSIAEGFGVIPSTLSLMPYIATWMAIVRNIGWKTARSFTSEQMISIYNKRGFSLTMTDFPELVQNVFNGYPFHNIAPGKECPFSRVLLNHMASRNDAGEFKAADVLKSYIPTRFMTPRIAAMDAGMLFRESAGDMMAMFPEMPEHGMAIFCALHPNQTFPSADTIGKKAFTSTFRRIMRALAPVYNIQPGSVRGKKRRRAEISQSSKAAE